MRNNTYAKFECPCCGFYTLDQKAKNTFQTCPIFIWEGEGIQMDDVDYEGGANRVSLNIARESYVKYGVADIRHKDLARKPYIDEYPDSGKSELYAI
ncbi:MAG: CPCC family cysteine-rich protein [Bacteroidota bacterium]|nr:CPCC family cysteine-rich protein [Bacteroidota bacterium]